MDTKKIANFIKTKRKEKNLSQEKLAQKLFVTEKAISRWETGRGTPDISLLIPLAKALSVSVSEILTGEKKESTEEIINYHEIRKKEKYNIFFKIAICCYILSLFLFLFYLKLDYSKEHLSYIIQLLFIIGSSLLVIIGTHLYENNCLDKIEEKNKIKKGTMIAVFIYYAILLFNTTLFARKTYVNAYNIIPFKSIREIITNGSSREITINILGNFFIFMPLEYFLIELFCVRKRKENFFISFIILLAFESVQYIGKLGVFDIDDILLCTAGMMVFHILYTKCKEICLKRKKHIFLFTGNQN